MAEEHGSVWIGPPPPVWVLKVMNVVMRPLLSSPAGKRMKGMMLLEFSGRRTGKTFKLPVNFHLVEGVPMAFTDRPWRLNFKGGAPVKVTYSGQVRHATGTLVAMTPEQMGLAVRESLDHRGSAQRMGPTSPPSGQPSDPG